MLTTATPHVESQDLLLPVTPEVTRRQEIADALEKVFPQIAHQATSDKHLRALIIAEPLMIIESFIARETGISIKMPEEMKCRVVEDAVNLVNLVIPAQSAKTDSTDPLTRLLAEASHNPDLRSHLRSSPKAAIEAGVTRLIGENFTMRDDVTVVVHEPSLDEIVLVIPPQTLGRAASMDAYEGLFDQPLTGPVMGTEQCNSMYFTNCWGSCGVK